MYVYIYISASYIYICIYKKSHHFGRLNLPCANFSKVGASVQGGVSTQNHIALTPGAAKKWGFTGFNGDLMVFNGV